VNPTIVLHSTNLPSISKGSVVLYRQFEVGKIINVRPKANNFDIDVYIYPAYQDLLKAYSGLKVRHRLILRRKALVSRLHRLRDH